jgi:hypothetical protein
MDVRKATTYMFADRSWPKKVGLIALVSPVPVFGQLYAYGYANLSLRRMLKGKHETELPDVKLGWELCWRGIQVMLITIICGMAVGLLGAPFFTAKETSSDVLLPAIVAALQGPTTLLVTVISTALSGVVLARFALTNSFGQAFDPGKLWSLLRAEPAIWITFALVGFIATEGPYGLVWILPLHGGWEIAATILASTLFWSYGQMVNAHLIAQAFGWSNRTAALRAAQVRYRW